MSNVMAVDEGNFEAVVLKSSEPVVVDFWAQWCGPCRMLAPVLDRIALKFEGKVRVVKCDVDVNQELAARYGVRSIPNLLFFKDGKIANQAIGFMSEAQLSEKVTETLGP